MEARSRALVPTYPAIPHMRHIVSSRPGRPRWQDGAVGTVPPQLVTDLRFELGIRRAVETGTFHGNGAASLAVVFPDVTTIELSPHLHEAAVRRFAETPGVQVVFGESGGELRRHVCPDIPTLYFLDAHYSGGETAGEEIDCPIMDELDALEFGNPGDCVVIDDARLFSEPPPPPRDASKWPALPELLRRIAQVYPDHYMAVVDDQIVAVPARARRIVEAWAANVETGRRPLYTYIWRLRPSRLRWRLAGPRF